MNLLLSHLELELPQNFEYIKMVQENTLHKTVARYGLELEKFIYAHKKFKFYDNIIFYLDNFRNNTLDFLKSSKCGDDDIVFSDVHRFDYIIGSFQSITKFSAAARHLDYNYPFNEHPNTDNKEHFFQVYMAMRLGLKVYEAYK